MPQRSGSANLPLHAGHVPAWLAERMARLGRVVVETVVLEYGRAELLRRLAHPFWFQSFGAVMGMDWHSSGITTSVIGALKRGLEPIQRELGIFVCGGKGMNARRTPAQLAAVGEATGLDAHALSASSRLVAKIDAAAVQDGFDLYLHAFFVSVEGAWCVVQQGMNESLKEARRYHWQSENLGSFFDSPHSGVAGRNVGVIVNLADARAERCRRAGVELACANPDRTVSVLRRWQESANRALPLFPDLEAPPLPSAAPHLALPAHHDIRATDVSLKRLRATLAAAADRGPRDFAELLLQPGVGARTVAALAFVAEIVHGAPSRFTDPARFAFAHGGKDGHPFPVPLKVYDETLSVLKRAVERAHLGSSETLAALRRLDEQARQLDAGGPSLDSHVAQEWKQSPSYGGRCVHSV